MTRWNTDTIRTIQGRLQGLDAELAAIEAALLEAQSPRLGGERHERVTALMKALKDSLAKALRENYVAPADGPHELEAFWFHVVRTVLHQDISERVNSVDRDKLLTNMFEARSTLATAIREAEGALGQG